jgi:hypothetical protein
VNASVRVGTTVGAALVLMAACFDRDPVRPFSTDQLVPASERVASDVDPTPPGDSPEFVSATVPMSNPLTGDGDSRRLGTYPSATLVVATAYGKINWKQDWGTEGWYGAAGWKGGDLLVRGSTFISRRVNGSTSPLHIFGSVSPFPGSKIDSVREVLTVSDSIRADRSKSGISNDESHQYQCGLPTYPTNSCIEFSGSTMVTLQRVSADLTLSADSTSVKVGSTVKFTFDRSPTSFEGKTIPVLDSVVRIWIPDDTSEGGDSTEYSNGPDSTTACGNVTATSCKRAINGPGRMVVSAKVNGQRQEKSVHVNAVPCPTGDSIVDRAAVRKGARNMWKDSGAEADTSVANNFEMIYGVYRDSITGQIFAQQAGPPGTPCEVMFLPNGVPMTVGAGKLIATMHPHPFPWGATYPANCGNMAGGKYYYPLEFLKGGGRPSGDDWAASKKLDVPGYIVDYDSLYRYDGRSADFMKVPVISPTGVDTVFYPRNGAQLRKSWPRVWNGCPMP